MSQALAATLSAATPPGSEGSGASAAGSEKRAKLHVSGEAPSSAPAPAPKLRSCVICRSRKVRCDKQSPCSNCRRANVECVFPSAVRPPRWARRHERLTNNTAASASDKVMDRLRNLESLVKELSGQLEQAHAAASSAGSGSSGVNSAGASPQDRDVEHHRDTSPATNTSTLHKQFGRMVVQDASHSRYVSSGFWSRVNDEIDGLKMETRGLVGYDSDSSEDEASPGKTSSILEVERTPAEQHAFLFKHNFNPAAPDLREFHPLPSQIPFLLDVFSENVNFVIQTVDMPTVNKMFRDIRSNGMKGITPSNEALMFSIYYTAITSMEEEDIVTNFGFSKSDLSLKYRVGLEHALAKADFLNAPDITLVQAFGLFLALVRRHDSPRYVWMMSGLVIRMAQYLGLQRDGSHFKHLTPFETEMRRRVWWAICMLDLRASEDQGTDLTIANGSYDTKIPLNINDADIDPESKDMPIERDGVTDMSFARISYGASDTMRQIMALGVGESISNLDQQSRLLNEIYQQFEHYYLQHATEPGNIAYWVAVTIARLVMAKMTLIVFLPVLFSSASETFSEEIRTKLLVAAIELAEYNHALNAEQACRQWRWVYQTYTHWHAIAYLLIDISRRPWSPIVERAWVALHSCWLIPAQTPIEKNLRIWVPLRKLMDKCRRHRDAELNRLRADPAAAAWLELEDQKFPLPSSSGPFPTGSSVDIFRERWRQLVGLPEGFGFGTETSGISGTVLNGPATQAKYANQPSTGSSFAYSVGDLSSNMAFESTYPGANGWQVGQTPGSSNTIDLDLTSTTKAPYGTALEQSVGPSYDPFPALPDDWSNGRNMGPGLTPWLWADADPSVDVFSNFDLNSIDATMDLDGEVNWYNWLESAKGMEMMDTGASGNSGF